MTSVKITRDFIEWDNDLLSVKVEDIDHQHQQLIDIINQLCKAILTRTAPQEIPEILENLEMYTVAHFSTEEALMRIFGYQEYEKHKLQHDELVSQLQSVRLKLAQGEHHVNSDLLLYLKDWLVQHIMRSDKQLGSFLEKQGIGKNKPWYKRIF
ncbi:bacteriohemerythrin [Suttonella ornithocola]|uniref:McHr n=1 Tax=Suttonella ornithocola TaxID=279832 RepID=A0A380MUD8_9GAMM|nr:bacteriohemerythrin [Suttonella ornithocola]SUO95794.1 McHr [Suttonella ornithocola]